MLRGRGRIDDGATTAQSASRMATRTRSSRVAMGCTAGEPSRTLAVQQLRPRLRGRRAVRKCSLQGSVNSNMVVRRLCATVRDPVRVSTCLSMSLEQFLMILAVLAVLVAVGALVVRSRVVR